MKRLCNYGCQWSALMENVKNHWGRYLIRVCDQVSGHCSGDFAYAGWPDDGENNQGFDMASLLETTDFQKEIQFIRENKTFIPALLYQNVNH